jgi:hypothetical protein
LYLLRARVRSSAHLLHTRLRVQRHPAFPAPSAFEGVTLMHHPGISCRGNADACPSRVIARSAATQSISPLALRRDGLLRFARNDGGACGCRHCDDGAALRRRSRTPSSRTSERSERRSGTHNHRPWLSGTPAARAWHNNDLPWLWVPAFAGTTPNFRTRLCVSLNSVILCRSTPSV